jgi:predicted nucleic acid-binding protein
LNRFVLDASIGLAWFVDDPVPQPAVDAWRSLQQGYRAVVPSLWILEMANGLAMAERRAALSPSYIDHCLRDIEVMLVSTLERAAASMTIRQAFNSASAFRLTAYDAVYLETARNEHLPLATLDRALRNAAVAAGVALFP